MSFASEFKEFAMKGSVADLAVGVVIGVAFGKIVASLVNDVIMPALSPLLGSVNFTDLALQISTNTAGKPVLLKYGIARRRFTPFVEAGATLRHLSALNGQGVQVDFYLQPKPATFHIEAGSGPDVAITAGGGVRWRLLAFDLAPKIRYLHWTSAGYQPVRNQAMLMLGISFPARK